MHISLFNSTDEDKAYGYEAVNELREQFGRDLTEREKEVLLTESRLITLTGRLIKNGAIERLKEMGKPFKIGSRFLRLRMDKVLIDLHIRFANETDPYAIRFSEGCSALMQGVAHVANPSELLRLRASLHATIESEPTSQCYRTFSKMAEKIDNDLAVIAEEFPYCLHPEIEDFRKVVSCANVGYSKYVH